MSPRISYLLVYCKYFTKRFLIWRELIKDAFCKLNPYLFNHAKTLETNDGKLRESLFTKSMYALSNYIWFSILIQRDFLSFSPFQSSVKRAREIIIRIMLNGNGNRPNKLKKYVCSFLLPLFLCEFLCFNSQAIFLSLNVEYNTAVMFITIVKIRVDRFAALIKPDKFIRQMTSNFIWSIVSLSRIHLPNFKEARCLSIKTKIYLFI